MKILDFNAVEDVKPHGGDKIMDLNVIEDAKEHGPAVLNFNEKTSATHLEQAEGASKHVQAKLTGVIEELKHIRQLCNVDLAPRGYNALEATSGDPRYRIDFNVLRSVDAMLVSAMSMLEISAEMRRIPA